MKNFRDSLNEHLKNPEFKKEWDATAFGKQIKKYLGCFKTRQETYKALADFYDNT